MKIAKAQQVCFRDLKRTQAGALRHFVGMREKVRCTLEEARRGIGLPARQSEEKIAQGSGTQRRRWRQQKCVRDVIKCKVEVGVAFLFRAGKEISSRIARKPGGLPGRMFLEPVAQKLDETRAIRSIAPGRYIAKQLRARQRRDRLQEIQPPDDRVTELRPPWNSGAPAQQMCHGRCPNDGSDSDAERGKPYARLSAPAELSPPPISQRQHSHCERQHGRGEYEVNFARENAAAQQCAQDNPICGTDTRIAAYQPQGRSGHNKHQDQAQCLRADTLRKGVKEWLTGKEDGEAGARDHARRAGGDQVKRSPNERGMLRKDESEHARIGKLRMFKKMAGPDEAAAACEIAEPQRHAAQRAIERPMQEDGLWRGRIRRLHVSVHVAPKRRKIKEYPEGRQRKNNHRERRLWQVA